MLIQFLLIHTIRANIAQPVPREMIAATAPPSPQPPQLPPEVEFSCRELAKKSAHTAADLRKVAHRRLKSLREYFNISTDNPAPPCIVRACNVLLQDYINRATITVTTRTLLADESNPDSEYIIMQRDTPNKGEKFLLRGAAQRTKRAAKRNLELHLSAPAELLEANKKVLLQAKQAKEQPALPPSPPTQPSKAPSRASTLASLISKQAELMEELRAVRTQLAEEDSPPSPMALKLAEFPDAETIVLPKAVEARLLSIYKRMHQILLINPSLFTPRLKNTRESALAPPSARQAQLGKQSSSEDGYRRGTREGAFWLREREGSTDGVPLISRDQQRDVMRSAKERGITNMPMLSTQLEPRVRPTSSVSEFHDLELELEAEYEMYIKPYLTTVMENLGCSARWIANFTAGTLTISPAAESAVDELQVHIKPHVDKKNKVGSRGISINVFEDPRDRYTSGLYLLKNGRKYYTGPGATTATFQSYMHGVDLPVQGSRYSLTLYCNEDTCTAGELFDMDVPLQKVRSEKGADAVRAAFATDHSTQLIDQTPIQPHPQAQPQPQPPTEPQPQPQPHPQPHAENIFGCKPK